MTATPGIGTPVPVSIFTGMTEIDDLDPRIGLIRIHSDVDHCDLPVPGQVTIGNSPA